MRCACRPRLAESHARVGAQNRRLHCRELCSSQQHRHWPKPRRAQQVAEAGPGSTRVPIHHRWAIHVGTSRTRHSAKHPAGAAGARRQGRVRHGMRAAARNVAASCGTHVGNKDVQGTGTQASQLCMSCCASGCPWHTLVSAKWVQWQPSPAEPCVARTVFNK